MSHFSTLVVTDEKPTNDVLTNILQPWHEFECTGKDDQYVIDVNDIDDLRASYVKDTTRRLREPSGILHSPYDDRFYRDPTREERASMGPCCGTGGDGKISWTSKDWSDGLGYRTKIHFVPDEWQAVELQTRECVSFRDFVVSYTGRPVVDQHAVLISGDEKQIKYGRIVVDKTGEVIAAINRTNPNKKWDWWMVGGRYGSRLSTGKTPCDVAMVRDLDFVAMRRQKIGERQNLADAVLSKGLTLAELDEGIIAARDQHRVWLELPEPRPRGDAHLLWLAARSPAAAKYYKADTWRDLVDSVAEGQAVTQWINAAPPLSAWAIVIDGTWNEKGKMGWWGISSGDRDDWELVCAEVISALRPDQFIAVVDCHI